jgi:hypothetical protein
MMVFPCAIIPGFGPIEHKGTHMSNNPAPEDYRRFLDAAKNVLNCLELRATSVAPAMDYALAVSAMAELRQAFHLGGFSGSHDLDTKNRDALAATCELWKNITKFSGLPEQSSTIPPDWIPSDEALKRIRPRIGRLERALEDIEALAAPAAFRRNSTPNAPAELTPPARALAAVVAAWPGLPESIKAGIVAMVKAARS